jgi:hypothetical protein
MPDRFKMPLKTSRMCVSSPGWSTPKMVAIHNSADINRLHRGDFQTSARWHKKESCFPPLFLLTWTDSSLVLMGLHKLHRANLKLS